MLKDYFLTVTLNVSLCAPDGIVIASDSLLTVSQPLNQRMNVDSTCPKCNESIQLKDVAVPPLSVPSSTFPYAQKLFMLCGHYGLAVHGAASLNGRSMYSHVTELNERLKSDASLSNDIEKVRDEIIVYFDKHITLECAKTGFDLNLIPDNWWPFGFQLAGFTRDASDEPAARIYQIKMGKRSSGELVQSVAFCTGDVTVVNLLWPGGNMTANVQAFSLQDAIDYAKFLIRTTADYQRFSGKMPSVGGEIDIALITHQNGYKWIAQKPLYQLLEKED